MATKATGSRSDPRLIAFSIPQSKWLEDEARKLGITVNELVRRIVDARRGAL